MRRSTARGPRPSAGADKRAIAAVASNEFAARATGGFRFVTDVDALTGVPVETFSIVDIDGVALAAIQGLNARLEAKERELSAQRAAIDALTARLRSLEERIADAAK